MSPRSLTGDLRTQLWHLRHGGVSQWRTYRRRAGLPAGPSASAVVTGAAAGEAGGVGRALSVAAVAGASGSGAEVSTGADVGEDAEVGTLGLGGLRRRGAYEVRIMTVKYTEMCIHDCNKLTLHFARCCDRFVISLRTYWNHCLTA